MPKSIDKQVAGLVKKLDKIASVEVPRANSSALNKSAQRIRTRVVSGVSKEKKIKPKAVRSRVFIKRSTAKTQRATLSAYRGDVSVASLLTASQKNKIGSGTNRRGVRAAGRQYDGAFVQRANGAVQVFQRKGKSRLPLKVVRIRIKEAVDRITRKVSVRVMKQTYPKLVERELKYRLGKYKK